MEKITITPYDKNNRLQLPRRFNVLFNPNAYTVGKTVGWTAAGPAAHPKLNAPPLRFNGGQSRTLTLELFYDVTEPILFNGVPRVLDDVRDETNRMVALTRIDGVLGWPPVVEVSWGEARSANSDFPFTGVVTSLNQSFTLFSAAGKPLRATLHVTFLEMLLKELDQRKTDPELTTRVVVTGDRLDVLAAHHYRDPASWRVIAEANKIDDPRRLPAGLVLTIPST
jgi:nucleoid-associated protein YgaU